MNKEDIQTMNDCLEILTHSSCNYWKTAQQLENVFRRNKIHELGLKDGEK